MAHRLQLTALNYQVRFSKFHEHRAEVIAGLASKLADAHWASSRVTSHFNLVEKATEEAEILYQAAFDTVQGSFRYFDANRTYLPAVLCERLESFFKELRSQILNFTVYSRTDHHSPTNVQQDKLKVWVETAKYFESEVPSARRALEDELRTIIDPTAPV